MSKATLAKAEPLKKGFDAAWRAKVKQYQVSLYSPDTKGAWVLRFDDVLADALELGPLADKTIFFSDDEKGHIKGCCLTVCSMKWLRQSSHTVLPTSPMIRIMSFCLFPTLMLTSEIPASATSGSICSLIRCLKGRSRALGCVG
jgi:hypothetical protein